MVNLVLIYSQTVTTRVQTKRPWFSSDCIYQDLDNLRVTSLSGRFIQLIKFTCSLSNIKWNLFQTNGKYQEYATGNGLALGLDNDHHEDNFFE